jgi:hypothetical protein
MGEVFGPKGDDKPLQQTAFDKNFSRYLVAPKSDRGSLEKIFSGNDQRKPKERQDTPLSFAPPQLRGWCHGDRCAVNKKIATSD